LARRTLVLRGPDRQHLRRFVTTHHFVHRLRRAVPPPPAATACRHAARAVRDTPEQTADADSPSSDTDG
ncbi:hypothetical protein, partial [Singulisphaera acidiphila]|uniref:hypothetical protein n=1 Tax=Singulisphaera acidiphila TaxID=466153 RepID=UPI001ED97557